MACRTSGFCSVVNNERLREHAVPFWIRAVFYCLCDTPLARSNYARHHAQETPHHPGRLYGVRTALHPHPSCLRAACRPGVTVAVTSRNLPTQNSSSCGLVASPSSILSAEKGWRGHSTH